MKIKCYALYDGNKEIFSQFTNNSQRSFLDYELKDALKRSKKSGRIEFQHTSNGVWYTKVSQKTSRVHLILLSKQQASISLASSIISQAQELDEKKTSVQMFRMKISDTIKMSNANKKIDQVSNSVIELEGIIKGNVNKLVTNMGDLESVEKKSEMMTSLSLQFEKDAKKLQEKMKRKNCMTKIAIFGGLTLVIVFVVYFVFLV